MSRARGFTLIEVIASLAIGAFVVLAARATFDSISASLQQLRDRSAQREEESRFEMTRRSTLAMAHAGPNAPFHGLPAEMRFQSQCLSPGGWHERCAVVIALRADSGIAELQATVGSGPLRDRAGGIARFLYLANAARGGTWLTKWPNTHDLPLAIGFASAHDTLIVPLGARP
jgi:prepilin-type N-terminal cleavage/methylation domain-containing protein